MKAPRNVKAKTVSGPKLEQDLDRSRKHKLWLRANWIGTILIAAFFVLTILSVVSDVRGEYGGGSESLGSMVTCSITHTDHKITAHLLVPKTPLLVCETSDQNVGPNVDWVFKPVKAKKGLNPVHFKGKVDSSSISGILQDGIRIYPITLEKDMLACIAAQLRVFAPNRN